MKARAIVVGAMAMLLSGCMTTNMYEVTQAHQDPTVLSKMFGGLIGIKVVVTSMNGVSDVGYLSSITTDRVDLLEEGAVEHLFIPLDSVQSIIKTGSTSGSIIGFLGGGVLGGFLGGVIGAASAQEPEDDLKGLLYEVSGGRAASTAVGFLIGFGAGGALGAVIGMNITDHEIYTFNRMGPVRDTLRLSPKEIIQETATTITVRSGEMELTLPKLSVQIIREPERITIIGPRKLLRPGGA